MSRNNSILSKSNRGFTLIELLVVIAIIGILAVIVLLALSSARQKARDARAQSDVRSVVPALELYNDQRGLYPWAAATACYPTVRTSDYVSYCVGAAPKNSCFDYVVQQCLVASGYLAAVPQRPSTAYQYRFCRNWDGTKYHIDATRDGSIIFEMGMALTGGGDCPD